MSEKMLIDSNIYIVHILCAIYSVIMHINYSTGKKKNKKAKLKSDPEMVKRYNQI